MSPRSRPRHRKPGGERTSRCCPRPARFPVRISIQVRGHSQTAEDWENTGSTHEMPPDEAIRGDTHPSGERRPALVIFVVFVVVVVGIVVSMVVLVVAVAVAVALAGKVEDGPCRVRGVGLGADEREADVEAAEDLGEVGGLEDCGLELGAHGALCVAYYYVGMWR